ncbi:MAG: hypothetical protein DRJ97_07805, partial [Thermoprotei archaeon]
MTWTWPLKPGESWFKEWKEGLGFSFKPAPPSTIVYVEDAEGRGEHYYDEEVNVKGGEEAATVVLTPRFKRASAPGPRSLNVVGGDPLKVAALSSPFDLPGIRGACTAWSLVWLLIFYFAIYIPGLLLLFAPPEETVIIAGEAYKLIPAEWAPDPVKLSFWILATGFCIIWIIVNIFRFKDATVLNVTLLEVGRLGGAPLCVPLPRPLSTLSPKQFMNLLGKKGPIEFVSNAVRQALASATSLVRENEQLR